MESREFNYISETGYISTCSSLLEVNLYIDKMFPAKDTDYFLPVPLFFKPYKLANLSAPKELAENKLFIYFGSLYQCEILSYINAAIVECLKIDSSPKYNIERAMALCSLRICNDSSGYEICYSALKSSRIFTMVYALLYINNKVEQLDHIINCIKQQSETDNTDFFVETFLQVKKYIESNKSSLTFTLPKPYFYEDELDKVNWLVETRYYNAEFLRTIANSSYDRRVRIRVLGKILQSYKRDRDIDYNLNKLDAESFLESELSLLYANNEVQISYPTQLMQRRIITDTNVCKWFVQEFLLSCFCNSPFKDIQRVFLGSGDGKLVSLTAKKSTNKGDIALVICYLCQGEKVKEETLTYFKKMIKDSNGDPLFTGVNPLSAAKHKVEFYKSVRERIRNRIGEKSFEVYKKNISWLPEEES